VDEDRRRDYGERRLVSTGEIDGECHRLHLARRQTQNQRAAPDGENVMPIVRRSVKEIRKHAGRVDWQRVRQTTDREIAAQIATDPDTAPDMAEARDLRRAYNPPVPNVKAIRHKLGLSQAAFAHQFGFSVRTVQQWEQGRAVPDLPARILLRVIETDPQAVEHALAAGTGRN
jgi:putative transcriptional regulator